MSQQTQGSSAVEEEREPLNRTVSLKISDSENAALNFVAGAKKNPSPATLFREFSLREIVAEAERLRRKVAA